MGVNGEALQLHAVYKKPYFLLQVTRESVSVLQVTWESISVLQVVWESVSGTASHMHCIWACNEIEGSYDKIIITIVPSYSGENITRLLSFDVVCAHWHCCLCCTLITNVQRQQTCGIFWYSFVLCMVILTHILPTSFWQRTMSIS